MQKRTSNTLNMIRAVILFLTNNALLNLVTAFANAKSAVEAKLVVIDGLTQIAETPTSGVTLNTKLIKEAMIKFAFKCASSLKAYANTPGTPDGPILLAKVNYTLSDLEKFKKEVIDDICQTIHDAANANISIATQYNYDTSDVTALQGAITLYRASIQSPRQAVVSKSESINQAKELTRSIVDIQFKGIMDNLVDGVQFSDSKYFSGYYKSREIIDLGSTHAKIRGTVQNPSKTVLQGVSVFITPVGQQTVVLQTTTNENGAFTLNEIPAGTYDLHFQYTEGYISIIQTNLQITLGKEVKRKIILKYQTNYTIQIPVGEFRVCLSPATPVWRPTVSLNIKNVNPTETPSTASGYATYSPTDPGPGNGEVVLNSQQDRTETNIEAQGFKPYLSFANTGNNPLTIQITIL